MDGMDRINAPAGATPSAHLIHPIHPGPFFWIRVHWRPFALENPSDLYPAGAFRIITGCSAPSTSAAIVRSGNSD